MLALALAFAGFQPASAAEDGSVLRDSETELLFRELSRPIIEAAGLQPSNVKIVLINDPEINAFVATGQSVYIQTGLLTASDNVGQLQGVIAHELGHVAGGHSIRLQQGLGGAFRLPLRAGIVAQQQEQGECNRHQDQRRPRRPP